MTHSRQALAVSHEVSGLLPFRRFVLHTPMTTEQICAQLRQDLAGPGLVAGLFATSAWCGEVSHQRFRIWRNLPLMGRTRPVIIIGIMESTPSGTTITVTMRPSWFMCAYLVALVAFVVSLAPTVGVGFYGMLAVGVVAMLASYASRAAGGRAHLESLVQASRVEPVAPESPKVHR